MKQKHCEYCDTKLNQVKKSVIVYRHRRGQHFIFQQVPALVCQGCGARYFSVEVVREMERLMQLPTTQTNFVPVPLISFPSQMALAT